MQRYLLTIYQPDGPPPPPEILDPLMRNLDAWNAEVRAAGAWVFDAALHPPDTATVLQAQHDDVLVVDGPFAESKEHMGGFTVIQAEDLDVALDWARKLTRALALPIEVRPMYG